MAGLTASTLLAEGGRPVDVYDSKVRLAPSSGAHTEGIRNYRPVDALQELRSAGFDLAPFARVQHTFRYSPHARNEIVGPAHYLFLRGTGPETVDQQLLRRCKAAGVRFHLGETVDPSEVDLVATGPPRDRTGILGAGYTVRAEGATLRPDSAYALFDNEVAPHGYLAITPGPASHSIYSVSWSELDYGRLLARVERAFGIPWVRDLLGPARRVGRIHGRASYVQDPIARAERDGVLYVGEAGGFQDAVAGFGFRYAALSGVLAARAVLRGRDYRELLRETFGTEFQDAYAFRERLNRATNEDYDAMVGRLGPRISLAEYVAQREPRGL